MGQIQKLFYTRPARLAYLKSFQITKNISYDNTNRVTQRFPREAMKDRFPQIFKNMKRKAVLDFDLSATQQFQSNWVWRREFLGFWCCVKQAECRDHHYHQTDRHRPSKALVKNSWLKFNNGCDFSLLVPFFFFTFYLPKHQRYLKIWKRALMSPMYFLRVE